jgi:hypothetical protein
MFLMSLKDKLGAVSCLFGRRLSTLSTVSEIDRQLHQLTSAEVQTDLYRRFYANGIFGPDRRVDTNRG